MKFHQYDLSEEDANSIIKMNILIISLALKQLPQRFGGKEALEKTLVRAIQDLKSESKIL